MANHLEFGSIAVGSPGSEARLKAEREDCLIGLRRAMEIIEDYAETDPDDWCRIAYELLVRVEKQTDGQTMTNWPGFGWMPISSAPKDGTKILAFNSEGLEIVEWKDDEHDGIDGPGSDAGWIGVYAWPGRTAKDHYASYPQGQPTYWMPLPAEPEDDSE